MIENFTYFPLCLRQRTRGGSIVSGRPSVRPSVNTYYSRRDVSVLSEGISMKIGTNICRAMGIAKTYQGQRSKVKVMTRSNAGMTEACILTVLHRGSFVLFCY